MRLGVLASVVFLGVFSVQGAVAQQLDNTYTDWSVFTLNQSGKKVCYIASAPKQKAGNYNKRGEPYVLVTHIGPAVDEASASSGYPYKEGSEVQFAVGSQQFKMFTKGELAWAYDSSQDTNIVQNMKKGMDLTVKGTSARGTYSTDTYSLRGFSKAYDRMKALCK